VDEFLEFHLASLASFNNVLEGNYGYNLPFEATVNLWEYFTTVSQMRYINILKEVYPIDEVIKAIITLVSKNFNKPLEFFENFSKGAQFWNASAFKALLDSGEIEIIPEQLRTVIRQWNKDEKREYLTFKEFLKVFSLGEPNSSLLESTLNTDQKKNLMNSSQNIPATASYEN
jgi:hypothetical protein